MPAEVGQNEFKQLKRKSNITCFAAKKIYPSGNFQVCYI